MIYKTETVSLSLSSSGHRKKTVTVDGLLVAVFCGYGSLWSGEKVITGTGYGAHMSDDRRSFEIVATNTTTKSTYHALYIKG